MNKLDFLTTAPKLYNGKYLSHPKVDDARSATVEIDAAEPLPIEVDGEPIGTTPARFEVVPAALRVRVPALQSCHGVAASAFAALGALVAQDRSTRRPVGRATT